MSKIQSQLNTMLESNGKISNSQGIKYAYDRDNKIFLKEIKCMLEEQPALLIG